jgi:hypothetical protein
MICARSAGKPTQLSPTPNLAVSDPGGSFAERAAPQLIQWESAYGWSHGTGAGKVAEPEIALAEVLAPMLTTPDRWTGFADAYLSEMDRIAAAERPLTGRRAAGR